jgi:ATP-dependent Lon protease
MILYVEEHSMTTKLTLSVEKRVVQKAKRYAQIRKKSLSEIVTKYLDYISSQPAEQQDIDPEVLEASGNILPERIPDLKDAKYRYLKEKYLHE